MVTMRIELSDDFARLFDSIEAANAMAREALVMELVHQVRISRGRAAELLGINAWDMQDLPGN